MSKKITCQGTESRHKTVKAKGHMTNRNPATYGLSILNTKARDSATQMMAQDTDTSATYSNQHESMNLNVIIIHAYTNASVY